MSDLLKFLNAGIQHMAKQTDGFFNLDYAIGIAERGKDQDTVEWLRKLPHGTTFQLIAGELVMHEPIG